MATPKPKRRKKMSHEEEQEVFEMMTAKKEEKKTPIQNVHIEIKCKTENQKKFIKLIKEKDIVIAAGFAGTGKTFLSCAEALKLLKSGKYKKITIVKSVTTLKDEEIGFLKGSMKDKMEPFMYSFRSNFIKLIGKFATEALEAAEAIEVLPLAFIRGMSIDDSILIIDEAQNISLDNMKSILTRIGENSKMIIIGDTKQIDGDKRTSSLKFIMDKFEAHPEFGIMKFEREDQVRNPLINIIEDVFDELDLEKEKGLK